MRYFGKNQLGEIDLDTNDHMKNPYSEGFSKVSVPEGRSGKWQVNHFTVEINEATLFNLRLIRDGQRKRVVPPGNYTRLFRDGEGVVMSDTPAESHEHAELYRRARGTVLLNGLGLGFALQAILTKDTVKQVWVIERSRDVIRLVKPSIKDKRVRVINANALTWKQFPGIKVDVAWHDIWTVISDDNRQQMDLLLAKYNKIARWQGCWSNEYMDRR